MSKDFKTISNIINEFHLVMTREEMIEKYKWFSLASGIKKDEYVLGLIKQAFKENTWQFRIN